MSDEELLEIISEGYGGFNEPARKDFVPLSAKNDYSTPYQRGGAVWPPIDRPVEGQGSLPWPLQLVPIDLGDSYVYLLSALKKIEQAVKTNKALTVDQIEKFKKIFSHGKKALKVIKEIGLVFETAASMAVVSKKPVPAGPIVVPKTMF